MRRFWPWTSTLTSEKLPAKFSEDAEHRISWKSDFYLSRNERHQRTYQPTNQRTRPTAIPPSGSVNCEENETPNKRKERYVVQSWPLVLGVSLSPAEPEAWSIKSRKSFARLKTFPCFILSPVCQWRKDWTSVQLIRITLNYRQLPVRGRGLRGTDNPLTQQNPAYDNPPPT